MILLSKVKTAVQIIFKIKVVNQKICAIVLTQNVQASRIRTIYRDHLKTTKKPM